MLKIAETVVCGFKKIEDKFTEKFLNEDGRSISNSPAWRKQMNQETFRYSYSAKENNEIQEIRKKYLSCGESKLEELKRLDFTVQSSGIIQSLCAGTGGMLVFGLGLSLAMQAIASGTFFVALGILLGIVGIVGMFVAYPVYRSVFNKTKAKYSSRILELISELSEDRK